MKRLCTLRTSRIFSKERRSWVKIQKSNSNPKARGEGKCRKVDSSNHLESSVKSKISQEISRGKSRHLSLSNQQKFCQTIEIISSFAAKFRKYLEKYLVKHVKSINYDICRCQSYSRKEKFISLNMSFQFLPPYFDREVKSVKAICCNHFTSVCVSNFVNDSLGLRP